jgi:hypothetical protein
MQIVLLAISTVVLLASAVVDLLSVHTYCENRVFMVGLGLLAACVIGLQIRNRTHSRGALAAKIAGLILNASALVSNLYFFIYYTHLCDQFRS